MKIDPLALKAALRTIGTILVALRAVPALGPWGELCADIGIAMIAYAQNGPGAVQSNDIAAILNAAKFIIPQNTELRIRSTPPPPSDTADTVPGFKAPKG